ncbi:MAG: hypothetical protein CBD88_00595 [Flavobacteriales bacterium TMED228]|nr:MAG: hypothetical protein CBD88_00595 [Flavobacteriales bacterium TMED228]
MPKVPVYQSQATPTTDTGMISYTRAQKDSRPYIQAALAEGETASTAASLISNFLDKRIRSEADLAADMALAGADAALESEVSRLSRATDPTAIFNNDLSGPDNWMGNVNDIRAASISNLNPLAQKTFNTKFAASAAKNRAKLRVKIDERVNASMLALHTVKQKNLILAYSNLDNSDSFPNATAMLDNFQNDILEYRNDGLKLVAEGRLSLDDHQANLLQIANQVTENTMTLFLKQQDNPLSAFDALVSNDGEMLALLASKHPNAGFAMEMLSQVPSQQARNELLAKLEDMAYKEYERKKTRNADDDKKIKVGNTKLLNGLFEPDISPEQFKKDLRFLRNQNFITPQMQKLIEKLEDDVDGTAVFRTTDEGDDDATVKAMEALVPFGALTHDILANAADKLTQDTFRSLMNDVGTIRKDKWSETAKGFRYEFGYAEEQGNNIEEYEQQAKQSFQQSMRLWNQFKRKNPRATAEEMQNEFKRIVDAEWTKLDQVLGIELKNTIVALEGDNINLAFPRLPNGAVDAGTVIQTLTDYIQSTDTTYLATSLAQLRYLVDMIGQR